MATRQPMLELPFWTDSKESQPEIVLIEGMQESKPTYKDWNYDIIIIVPRYTQYGVVCQSTLQKSYSLYKTGA